MFRGIYACLNGDRLQEENATLKVQMQEMAKRAEKVKILEEDKTTSHSHKHYLRLSSFTKTTLSQEFNKLSLARTSAPLDIDHCAATHPKHVRCAVIRYTRTQEHIEQAEATSPAMIPTEVAESESSDNESLPGSMSALNCSHLSARNLSH